MAARIYCILLLLVAGLAGPGAATTTDIASGAHTAQSTAVTGVVTYQLTPESPGTLETVVTLENLPSDRQVRIRKGEGMTVLEADGFSESGLYLVWDGETRNPTLRYRKVINVSAHEIEGQPYYSRVDAGDWALFGAYEPLVFVGDGAGVDRVENWRRRIAGEGLLSEDLVLLGPHEVIERTVEGERLRLVVPDAATPVVPPDRLAGMLENASRTLAVGDHPTRTTIVAATSGVSWSSRRQRLGEHSAWVLDDESVAGADNTWLQQYVRLRLDISTEHSTEWLAEAIPEYYSALVQLRTGRIDWTEFNNGVNNVEPTHRVDLTDPSAWTQRSARRYGETVLGGLDWQIRQATDGNRTLDHVVRRYLAQDGGHGVADFLDIVADVAGEETARTAERWVTAEAHPPSSVETDYHWEFGRNHALIRPRISYMATHGPTRSASPPETTFHMGVDERLQVVATVVNDGYIPGRFASRLEVYEQYGEHNLRQIETVDPTVVWVSQWEDRQILYEYSFEEPGEYLVDPNGYPQEVIVHEEPPQTRTPTATPSLTTTVPSTATRSRTAATSPTSVPSDAATTHPPVTNETDGSRPETDSATTNGGGSSAGTGRGHEGGSSAGTGTTNGGGPGFGLLGALLALLLTGFLTRRS